MATSGTKGARHKNGYNAVQSVMRTGNLKFECFTLFG